MAKIKKKLSPKKKALLRKRVSKWLAQVMKTSEEAVTKILDGGSGVLKFAGADPPLWKSFYEFVFPDGVGAFIEDGQSLGGVLAEIGLKLEHGGFFTELVVEAEKGVSGSMTSSVEEKAEEQGSDQTEDQAGDQASVEDQTSSPGFHMAIFKTDLASFLKERFGFEEHVLKIAARLKKYTLGISPADWESGSYDPLRAICAKALGVPQEAMGFAKVRALCAVAGLKVKKAFTSYSAVDKSVDLAETAKWRNAVAWIFRMRFGLTMKAAKIMELIEEGKISYAVPLDPAKLPADLVGCAKQFYGLTEVGVEHVRDLLAAVGVKVTVGGTEYLGLAEEILKPVEVQVEAEQASTNIGAQSKGAGPSPELAASVSKIGLQLRLIAVLHALFDVPLKWLTDGLGKQKFELRIDLSHAPHCFRRVVADAGKGPSPLAFSSFQIGEVLSATGLKIVDAPGPPVLTSLVSGVAYGPPSVSTLHRVGLAMVLERHFGKPKDSLLSFCLAIGSGEVHLFAGPSFFADAFGGDANANAALARDLLEATAVHEGAGTPASGVPSFELATATLKGFGLTGLGRVIVSGLLLPVLGVEHDGHPMYNIPLSLDPASDLAKECIAKVASFVEGMKAYEASGQPIVSTTAVETPKGSFAVESTVTAAEQKMSFQPLAMMLAEWLRDYFKLPNPIEIVATMLTEGKLVLGLVEGTLPEKLAAICAKWWGAEVGFKEVKLLAESMGLGVQASGEEFLAIGGIKLEKPASQTSTNMGAQSKGALSAGGPINFKGLLARVLHAFGLSKHPELWYYDALEGGGILKLKYDTDKPPYCFSYIAAKALGLPNPQLASPGYIESALAGAGLEIHSSPGPPELVAISYLGEVPKNTLLRVAYALVLEAAFDVKSDLRELAEALRDGRVRLFWREASSMLDHPLGKALVDANSTTLGFMGSSMDLAAGFPVAGLQHTLVPDLPTAVLGIETAGKAVLYPYKGSHKETAAAAIEKVKAAVDKAAVAWVEVHKAAADWSEESLDEKKDPSAFWKGMPIAEKPVEASPLAGKNYPSQLAFTFQVEAADNNTMPPSSVPLYPQPEEVAAAEKPTKKPDKPILGVLKMPKVVKFGLPGEPKVKVFALPADPTEVPTADGPYYILNAQMTPIEVDKDDWEAWIESDPVRTDLLADSFRVGTKKHSFLTKFVGHPSPLGPPPIFVVLANGEEERRFGSFKEAKGYHKRLVAKLLNAALKDGVGMEAILVPLPGSA